MSGVRIDKWLWCVRVFKTRSSATDACTRGRVTIDDEPVKPARRVKVGDHISVRRRDRVTIVEVVELIEKRVGAAIAQDCFVDHSPLVPRPTSSEFHPMPQGQREQGAGRPTKRDRRQIERLRDER